MFRFISILGVLVFFANIANAQNSPCYWSGSVVKCFPTTGIYLDKQKSLRLGDSGTTNYVELKGGSSITTYSVTLPTAQGAASTAMVNDGSGGLTWTAVSANPATAPILLADGSVSAPSLAFGSSGNTNTGLYLVGTDSPGFVANGVNVGQYSSAGAWTVGPSSGGDLTQTITSGGQTTLSVLSTGSNVNARIKISATGTGIPHLQLDKAGSTKWELGSDNSLFGTDGLYLVAGATTVLGSTSAGVWTLGPSAAIGANTYAGNKIVGVTNASDVAAGYVGEYFQNARSTNLEVHAIPSGRIFDIDSGASVSGSDTTGATGIVLTPGDWDIEGSCYYVPVSASGVTQLSCWIGTATANAATGRVLYANFANGSYTTNPAANVDLVIITPVWRTNISATTTYYLKGQMAYSSLTTMNTQGIIRARRVR